MTASIIRLESVSKSFGAMRALGPVSLEIASGEFFSLLGPSGCGKTTLLRTIAGFETPDAGDVFIDGRPMAGVEANRRPTNMVFQSYAIFPHMTVGENVGFGLRRLGRKEAGIRIDDALRMVSLEGFRDRNANALSGGQRQRVALARALVMRPKVLLLDEPLSALDKSLREQMQMELRQLQRSVGITFLLVTHDQEEALTMSDRIAIMFEGRIAQLATPEQLYRRPETREVADFLGSMNFLPAREISRGADSVEVEIEGLGKAALSLAQAPAGLHAHVAAGLRPESFTMLYDEDETSGRIATGRIADLAYYGDMTYYQAVLDGATAPVAISMRNAGGRPVLPVGTTVRVRWDAESIILL